MKNINQFFSSVGKGFDSIGQLKDEDKKAVMGMGHISLLFGLGVIGIVYLATSSSENDGAEHISDFQNKGDASEFKELDDGE